MLWGISTSFSRPFKIKPKCIVLVVGFDCLSTGVGVVVLGSMAARAHGLESVENSEEHEDGPDEEGKGDSSLSGAAVCIGAAVRGSNKDSKGDGASEPEDGGNDEQRERNELVEEAGHVQRGQADVSKYEQRPDRVEDEKVDDIGRARPPTAPAVVAIVAAGNCDGVSSCVDSRLCRRERRRKHTI